MATPKKTPAGTWHVQIEVRGVRDSGTFATKREAADWAARRSADIRAMAGGRAGTVKTLADAVDRYAEEVSPSKRGWAKELIRLQAFKRQSMFPGQKKLADITPADLSAWRDARLAVNARGSVLRDMTLLSHVFEVARRDWQWVERNPLKDVRRPAEPDHRQRIITGPEVRQMLRVMGWTRRGRVETVTQSVAWCFLAALATGMRAGELCALQWPDVRADHVVLHVSKTGAGRMVPLSPVAARVLQAMRGWDEASVFGLRPQTLDAFFRRYRQRAGLIGFVFHDARHTAATRMARRLDVLDLCKVFGWTNATMALTYYNPSASQIAARLR